MANPCKTHSSSVNDVFFPSDPNLCSSSSARTRQRGQKKRRMVFPSCTILSKERKEETHMEPENHWVAEENSLPKVHAIKVPT